MKQLIEQYQKLKIVGIRYFNEVTRAQVEEFANTLLTGSPQLPDVAKLIPADITSLTEPELVQLIGEVSKQNDELAVFRASLIRYMNLLHMSSFALKKSNKEDVLIRVGELCKLIHEHNKNASLYLDQLIAKTFAKSFNDLHEIEVTNLRLSQELVTAAEQLKDLQNSVDKPTPAVLIAARNKVLIALEAVEQSAFNFNEKIKAIFASLNNMTLNEHIKQNLLQSLSQNTANAFKKANTAKMVAYNTLLNNDLFKISESLEKVLDKYKEPVVFAGEKDEAYIARLNQYITDVDLYLTKIIAKLPEHLETLLKQLKTNDVFLEATLRKPIIEFLDNQVDDIKQQLQGRIDNAKLAIKNKEKPLADFLSREIDNVIEKKIIILKFNDASSRSIAGIPSGGHSKAILFNGKDVVWVGFVGNLNNFIGPKDGIISTIFKPFSVPVNVYQGVFTNFKDELDAYEKSPGMTYDATVLQCGDNVGLDFDKAWIYVQNLLTQNIPYCFLDNNCASTIGQILVEADAAKFVPPNYVVPLLKTAVPEYVQKYAIEVSHAIDLERAHQLENNLANEAIQRAKAQLPKNKDGLIELLRATQSSLELKLIQVNTLESDETIKTFLQVVNDAFNSLVSRLPPFSDDREVRSKYIAKLLEELIKLNEYIYDQYVKNEVRADIREEFNRAHYIIYHLITNIDTSIKLLDKIAYEINAEIKSIGDIFDKDIQKIVVNEPDFKDGIVTAKTAINKHIKSVVENIPVIDNEVRVPAFLRNLQETKHFLEHRKEEVRKRNVELNGEKQNIKSNRQLNSIQKTDQISAINAKIKCNENLVKYYNSLQYSLTAKEGEINRFLYLDSPSAKLNQADKSPFVHLWNLLLPDQQIEASQDSKSLQQLATTEVCSTYENRLPKPWFFQIEKMRAYKEQQVKIAVKTLLDNQQMSFKKKTEEIHRIFNDNLPSRYEYWFSSATKPSKTRLDNLIDKSYILCALDSFTKGELNSEQVINIAKKIAAVSRCDGNKPTLNAFAEGVTALKAIHESVASSDARILQRVPLDVVPQPSPSSSTSFSGGVQTPTDALVHPKDLKDSYHMARDRQLQPEVEVVHRPASPIPVKQ